MAVIYPKAIELEQYKEEIERLRAMLRDGIRDMSTAERLNWKRTVEAALRAD